MGLDVVAASAVGVFAWLFLTVWFLSFEWNLEHGVGMKVEKREKTVLSLWWEIPAL